MYFYKLLNLNLFRNNFDNDKLYEFYGRPDVVETLKLRRRK